VEAILLDGPANGITFDWSKARGVSEKLILAGGLNASNVAEAIRIVQPWGVDASSGLESAPGIKDHDKVRQFVKAAQEAS
jgi:phosphoribosylanthranilate isomerase